MIVESLTSKYKEHTGTLYEAALTMLVKNKLV